MVRALFAQDVVEGETNGGDDETDDGDYGLDQREDSHMKSLSLTGLRTAAMLRR